MDDAASTIPGSHVEDLLESIYRQLKTSASLPLSPPSSPLVSVVCPPSFPMASVKPLGNPPGRPIRPANSTIAPSPRLLPKEIAVVVLVDDSPTVQTRWNELFGQSGYLEQCIGRLQANVGSAKLRLALLTFSTSARNPALSPITHTQYFQSPAGFWQSVRAGRSPGQDGQPKSVGSGEIVSSGLGPGSRSVNPGQGFMEGFVGGIELFDLHTTHPFSLPSPAPSPSPTQSASQQTPKPNTITTDNNNNNFTTANTTNTSPVNLDPSPSPAQTSSLAVPCSIERYMLVVLGSDPFAPDFPSTSTRWSSGRQSESKSSPPIKIESPIQPDPKTRWNRNRRLDGLRWSELIMEVERREIKISLFGLGWDKSADRSGQVVQFIKSSLREAVVSPWFGTRAKDLLILNGFEQSLSNKRSQSNSTTSEETNKRGRTAPSNAVFSSASTITTSTPVPPSSQLPSVQPVSQSPLKTPVNQNPNPTTPVSAGANLRPKPSISTPTATSMALPLSQHSTSTPSAFNDPTQPQTQSQIPQDIQTQRMLLAKRIRENQVAQAAQAALNASNGQLRGTPGQQQQRPPILPQQPPLQQSPMAPTGRGKPNSMVIGAPVMGGQGSSLGLPINSNGLHTPDATAAATATTNTSQGGMNPQTAVLAQQYYRQKLQAQAQAQAQAQPPIVPQPASVPVGGNGNGNNHNSSNGIKIGQTLSTGQASNQGPGFGGGQPGAGKPLVWNGEISWSVHSQGGKPGAVLGCKVSAFAAHVIPLEDFQKHLWPSRLHLSAVSPLMINELRNYVTNGRMPCVSLHHSPQPGATKDEAQRGEQSYTSLAKNLEGKKTMGHIRFGPPGSGMIVFPMSGGQNGSVKLMGMLFLKVPIPFSPSGPSNSSAPPPTQPTPPQSMINSSAVGSASSTPSNLIQSPLQSSQQQQLQLMLQQQQQQQQQQKQQQQLLHQHQQQQQAAQSFQPNQGLAAPSVFAGQSHLGPPFDLSGISGMNVGQPGQGQSVGQIQGQGGQGGLNLMNLSTDQIQQLLQAHNQRQQQQQQQQGGAGVGQNQWGI